MEHYLTYALRNDQLVHIDDVDEVGIACGCICPNPECGARLIAKSRRFPERQKCFHFAHESGADCGKARESALHLLAKQVLFEERKLAVPLIKGLPSPCDTLELLPAAVLQFDEVTLERSVGEFRPDAVGRIGSEEYFVEFLVTHDVGPQKAQVARAQRWRMIEVDLTNLLAEAYTRERVRGWLLADDAPRQWIAHPVTQSVSFFQQCIPKVKDVVNCPAGFPAKARWCDGCPGRFGGRGQHLGCFLSADFEPSQLPVTTVRLLKLRQDGLRAAAIDHAEQVFKCDMQNFIGRRVRSEHLEVSHLKRRIERRFIARCWHCLTDQVFISDARLGERLGRCTRCRCSWSPKEGGHIHWIQTEDDPRNVLEVPRNSFVWAERPDGGTRSLLVRNYTQREAQQALEYVGRFAADQGWPHRFGVGTL